MNGDRAQYLDHTFRCSHLSGNAHVADDESSEVGWFELGAMPEMNPWLEARILTAAYRRGPTRLDQPDWGPDRLSPDLARTRIRLEGALDRYAARLGLAGDQVIGFGPGIDGGQPAIVVDGPTALRWVVHEHGQVVTERSTTGSIR